MPKQLYGYPIKLTIQHENGEVVDITDAIQIGDDVGAIDLEKVLDIVSDFEKRYYAPPPRFNRWDAPTLPPAIPRPRVDCGCPNNHIYMNVACPRAPRVTS